MPFPLSVILSPLFSALALPLVWTAGLGIGIACIFHKVGCKRDLFDAQTPMIIQWNNTNLSMQDMAKAHGVTISMDSSLPYGQATFSNEHFSSNGTFIQRDSASGVRLGELSFRIPGLEPPLEGTWIAINHDHAEEQLKLVFEQTHKRIGEIRGEDEPNLRELFVQMAKMLDE